MVAVMVAGERLSRLRRKTARCGPAVAAAVVAVIVAGTSVSAAAGRASIRFGGSRRVQPPFPPGR